MITKWVSSMITGKWTLMLIVTRRRTNWWWWHSWRCRWYWLTLRTGLVHTAEFEYDDTSVGKVWGVKVETKFLCSILEFKIQQIEFFGLKKQNIFGFKLNFEVVCFSFKLFACFNLNSHRFTYFGAV
jgi:hypothetical protein